MIVTSFRAYLNVLTQMLTAEELVHANYYIGDSKDRTDFANVRNISINGAGETVYEEGSSQMFQQYSIKYFNCMDPDKTNDAQVTGYVEDADNEEKFIEHLNKPLTMYSVYKAMFHDQLRGNGLQIFMLRDDANMMRYGNIICQYLSFNFGVDIIYLDVKAGRKRAIGQAFYPGNPDKAFVLKTIEDVRACKTIADFKLHLETAMTICSIKNLKTYLEQSEYDELVYLFKLLFPTTPVPPGNGNSKIIIDFIVEHTMSIDPDIYATAKAREKEEWDNVRMTSTIENNDWENYDFSTDFGDDGGLF